MKKSFRSALALLLTLALVLGSFAGCAAEKSEELKPVATQTVTDSIGREVELPGDIQKLAPAGSLAQIVLYGLAPDRMVGWTTKPTEDMAKYFDEKYINLPTFGTFYGKNADLNIEALIAAAPQVVIDIGEAKGDMKADLDALQEQLGIPVIFVEAKLNSMGEAYRTLGDILNLPEEAKALADYCDGTVSQIKEGLEAIPADQRVSIYYGEGETGLMTNPKGSFHAEVIDLIGGVNVADIPITSGAGGNEISMEQLLLWDPDVIIFGPDSVYGKVGADPMWRDVAAVQQGTYYEIPAEPFNWMGRP
ncbi:MAG: ABC transporter substrate-binding protein, partial [Anaerovorax sp.]